MNNCTYLILPIAELNNIDYSDVSDKSADTVRKNIAETEFIVEWSGVMPTTIYQIAPEGDEDIKDCKTQAEMLVIVAGEDWTAAE